MAIPHAYPGMPVDLRPLGEALAKTETTALVKNNDFEAIRLVLPKGREVCHDHEVEGMITVYCIEGRVALTTGGATHELPAGHWTYLMRHDPHTLRALEDSSVLLTIMLHR
jgi:quercetin dioxygenase-like cupin family protein